MSEVGNPTVWVSDNFAQDWFIDPVAAAQGMSVMRFAARSSLPAVSLRVSFSNGARLLLQIEELERFFPTKPGTPDLQLTQYDERGWRATFYTTGLEHSPTSATGTGWEPTPWHATQRAAWEALRKVDVA